MRCSRTSSSFNLHRSNYPGERKSICTIDVTPQNTSSRRTSHQAAGDNKGLARPARSPLSSSSRSFLVPPWSFSDEKYRRKLKHYIPCCRLRPFFDRCAGGRAFRCSSLAGWCSYGRRSCSLQLNTAPRQCTQWPTGRFVHARCSSHAVPIFPRSLATRTLHARAEPDGDRHLAIARTLIRIVLPNGKVLVAGGCSITAAISRRGTLYPASVTWRPPPASPRTRGSYATCCPTQGARRSGFSTTAVISRARNLASGHWNLDGRWHLLTARSSHTRTFSQRQGACRRRYQVVLAPHSAELYDPPADLDVPRPWPRRDSHTAHCCPMAVLVRAAFDSAAAVSR